METIIINDNISVPAEIIKNGGLVAVPTETVYGLAGNGLDEKAVAKIYETKGRPEKKPLSLMVSGVKCIDELCHDVPKAAYALAERYWPGPLTIILPAKEHIPQIVLSGGTTVGLRCPKSEKTLELIEKAGVPLAAPSANPSGEKSPKNADKVLEYFNGKIEAVIDEGECSLGVESTIIDMSTTPYKIMREGAVPSNEIFRFLANNIKIVGITGGSGCGKTTALNVLREYGALIIDCDAVYHDLTVSSEDMKTELCERYGDVYNGNVLDRKKLGAIVFSDEKALKDLNAITHKYVNMEMERQILEFAKNGGVIAAVDAIALLDIKFSEISLFNIAIIAPTEERVKRLVAREGISEEYARLRISAQKSNEYFEQNCDYVLNNDSTMAAFEDKCKKFFSEVLKNVL